MTLRTTYGKFKFICNACGKQITDGKGVVDFPIPGISENKDAHFRNYHHGYCASLGNGQRARDKWGNVSLDEFTLELRRQVQ